MMKRLYLVTNILLFALLLLLPLGSLISKCFGYEIELTNYTVFSVICTIFSLTSIILNIRIKPSFDNVTINIIFGLMSPISFLNVFYYLFDYFQLWMVGLSVITVCCCWYLTLKHGKPIVLKIISIILSAFMILPICYSYFIVLIFGTLAQYTVVNTIKSPNETYYIEIIDNDQGALGGDTIIYLYENKGINAVIFKTYKKPTRILQDDYGAHTNMDIHWENDQLLIINSKEYDVKSILE